MILVDKGNGQFTIGNPQPIPGVSPAPPDAWVQFAHAILTQHGGPQFQQYLTQAQQGAPIKK